MLDYKGYHAEVEYRPDDGLLFGRVLGVRDTVVFEAETAASVRTAFEGAVGDTLASCADTGEDPDRPFSGRSDVRLPPDLHRAAAVAAEAEAEGLNHFVRTAVAREVERRGAESA